MSEPARRYYFEDLAVGQRFESASYTLDSVEIREFARRFDPQPFHTDEIAAKDSFFGGLAASGWHTAAITMRLLIDGGLPFASGLIGAGADLTWPNATRPGDTLTVFSQIAELRASSSRPDRGWVTVTSETRTATATVVQTLRTRMLVFRRPG